MSPRAVQVTTSYRLATTRQARAQASQSASNVSSSFNGPMIIKSSPLNNENIHAKLLNQTASSTIVWHRKNTSGYYYHVRHRTTP